MNWVDILLLIAALVGVGAACFLVARTPDFWVGLAIVVLQRAWPYLVKAFIAASVYIGKPMSPEDEKAWHQSIRRAEEWDPFRKKPRGR